MLIVSSTDSRHGDRVRTRIVVADFTSRLGAASLTAAYDGVRRGLDGLDAALLVNNAGTCYARPDRLLNIAPTCCSSGDSPPPSSGDPLRDIIECNVLATVAMSRIVMPLMVAGRTRGRDEERDEERPAEPSPPFTDGGVVVNVSSATAVIPCPLLAVYGASKVYDASPRRRTLFCS